MVVLLQHPLHLPTGIGQNMIDWFLVLVGREGGVFDSASSRAGRDHTTNWDGWGLQLELLAIAMGWGLNSVPIG